MSVKKQAGSQNIFRKNFSAEFSKFLSEKKYSHHFILADDNTVNHCLPVLFSKIKELKSATVIEIFAGESFKNIETAQQVWENLTELNADRRAVLINLGGGMVCDLGGFVAGTYKRGIDFIHVPTTVLSQVDAAYGGKQGIDFNNYKNQVGIFRDPSAIFVNTLFLKSLPNEQLVNGFAEVVKHGLLAGGKFWKRIYAIENISALEWKKIVNDAADIKLSVVEEDPFEKGLRKILNFGHTIGHAVETNLMNRGEEVLHGFCIAAGMIGELFLSQQVYGFSEKKMLTIVSFIRKHFPPVNMNIEFDDEVMRLMQQDKKNRNGKIQFALLQRIGQPVIGVEVDEQLIRKALDFSRVIYQ